MSRRFDRFAKELTLLLAFFLFRNITVNPVFLVGCVPRNPVSGGTKYNPVMTVDITQTVIAKRESKLFVGSITRS